MNRLRAGSPGPHISTFVREQYRDAFRIANPSSRLLAQTDDLIERAVSDGNVGVILRLAQALAEEISRPSGIGWSTWGHTAVDVNLYAFGPGSEHFKGSIDNTELGKRIALVLELDLDRETRELRENE